MEIASDMKKIVDSIVVAYDARTVALGYLVDGVHDTLDGFVTERKKLSKEQGARLAGFASGLARDVGHKLREFRDGRAAMASELSKNLKQYDRGIETGVAGLLRGFAQAHARMSRKLHGDLKDCAAGIALKTHGLLGGFRDEQGVTAANVRAAHAAWQDLTRTMAARRREAELAEPGTGPGIAEPAGFESPAGAGPAAPQAKHRRQHRKHKR